MVEKSFISLGRYEELNLVVMWSLGGCTRRTETDGIYFCSFKYSKTRVTGYSVI